MSLTLSSSDLAQLESAITTLVSPLHYETVLDWRKASRVIVERVIEADRSAGMIPMEGEPLGECHPDLLPAITDYVNYYHTLDVGLQVKRREMGLEVCHWSTVYDMRELVETEIYNDFNAPHGMLDCTGMIYDLDPAGPPAALLYYHEHETSKPFGERGLALLRLMMPAFKAGVESCLRLASRRAALDRLFDTMDNAFACFDSGGRLVQQNAAMTRLLAADPERRTLLAHMRNAATAMATTLRRTSRHVRAGVAVPPWSNLRTAARHYRVSASLLPPGLIAPKALIAVALDATDARQPSDAHMRSTFGLTAREMQVARLLAARHGSAAIAQTLGVSVHTARRHVEHVFMKLGVHSRRDVERALTI